MSKLYFGKFTKKEQIQGHYYNGNPSWYNGIKENDYVFVINGDVKALWKASYFEEIEDEESNLHFDEIISFSDIQFQIKDLVAIKEFKLDVDLCVKTIRSTAIEKKGFYEIELMHPDNIDNFLDASSFKKYIQDRSNYRNVIFYNDEAKLDKSSEDIQFYKSNGKFHIYKDCGFISTEMLDKFNDRVEIIKNLYENAPKEAAKRSKRLKTISYIEKSLADNKPIYKDEQALIGFYDIFFSDVEPSLSPRFKKKNINTDKKTTDIKTETILEESIIPNQINTILFGPPGTGKTYSTKRKAVKICNGKIDEQTINNDYEKLISEKRINFVTFHQSFGYEEFVEGIKPVVSDDEDSIIKYEIKDGVLKTAVINASYEYVKAKNAIKAKKTILEDNFENRWDQMLSEMRDRLDSKDPEVKKFKSRKDAEMCIERISDNGNLKFKVTNVSYTVSYARTKKLWNAFGDITKIKNIDKEIRAVIGGANTTSYYIVLEYLKKMKFDSKNSITVSDENLSIEEKKRLVNTLSNSDFTNANVKNHVLIIDEINRGNVAQIFGELITLIEKSKRAGSKDAVKIQLSYSGESFILPPNLFIIGTMNTSDRSVESLDAALRRRFSFEELAPNSGSLSGITVVDGNNEELEIDLSAILDIINKRLEFLLDYDHTMGHAYFLTEVHQNEENTDFITLDDLKLIFVNSIIPQLKEYFYNDWEKIQMVLSPAFIEVVKDVSPSELFFNVNTDIIDDEKKLFTVSDSTNWTEETFQSIYIRK